ncbi:MAG: YkgJ family cysteine cluster protein [Candidatus Desulfaltia sp.]|nr:YkgJ family cysteine cluster protein [Candidatus Desulfaltia sp.]
MKPSDIFKCEKCGDCCKGYGGTFVTEKDIKAIAGYLKTDHKSFIKDYCYMSGSRPVLAQQKNGYCIFWDKICTIHPVKPKMCKQWPFIKSVLIDVNNWQIMASVCPGIRIDMPDDIIGECVRKELSKNQ